MLIGLALPGLLGMVLMNGLLVWPTAWKHSLNDVIQRYLQQQKSEVWPQVRLHPCNNMQNMSIILQVT